MARTGLIMRFAAFLLLASVAAGAGTSQIPAPDPFAVMVKKGLDAWARLAAEEKGQIAPLKEVEPGWFSQDPPLREVASADGLMVAGTRDGSLYVRGRASDEIRVIAAPEGQMRWTIEDALWSPDGLHLAAKTIDDSAVPRITLTGPQFGPGNSRQVPYSRIGEPLPTVRVFMIEVATGKSVEVARRRDRPYINIVDWSADGRILRLLTADRHQRILELRSADRGSGSTTLLHVEPRPVSVTSLALLHGFSQRLRDMNLVRFLPDGSFVWLSDRSGFQHLYLYSASGRLVRSLTEGKLAGFVDRLVDVDVPNRRLFARVTGFDEADPYRHKLVRIDLDDRRITDLIEADHIPSVRLSADRKRVQLVKADFPSTVDIVEIEAGGGPAKTLFRTDWTEVEAAGFVRPEITYVLAADGKTRLRAVVEFPFGFDPSKRYPVIHSIYAGQHTISTPLSPRNQGPWRDARMGGGNFIFVAIDGRGTPGRGRAFQNHDYGRFGQVQAADQIAGIRALAATRPYMDLNRVGVIGGSWGGYFGLRTALEAPDLYKAGLFYAGAFEMSRMRVSAEPFMGCSKQECPLSYARASNIALIDRLKAPLLILHGTADNDVPIGESRNLVAALDRSGKPYEFVEVPGWNHFVSAWPEFGPRAMAFFKKHLGGPEEQARPGRSDQVSGH